MKSVYWGWSRCTSHRCVVTIVVLLLQVWISYAQFELSLGTEDCLQKTRDVYRDSCNAMKDTNEKEERLMLLENWKEFEVRNVSWWLVTVYFVQVAKMSRKGAAACGKRVRFPEITMNEDIKKRPELSEDDSGALDLDTLDPKGNVFLATILDCLSPWHRATLIALLKQTWLFRPRGSNGRRSGVMYMLSSLSLAWRNPLPSTVKSPSLWSPPPFSRM